MAIADLGIGSSDFIDNELADFGQTGTVTSVNETEDHLGNKILTFTGTVAHTLVFHTRKTTYVKDKDGVRKLAPAFIMHRTDSGIKKGDRIFVSTGTWKVYNVDNRRNVYQFSDLYLFG